MEMQGKVKLLQTHTDNCSCECVVVFTVDGANRLIYYARKKKSFCCVLVFGTAMNLMTIIMKNHNWCHLTTLFNFVLLHAFSELI
jgi:hypothetical protein